MNKDTKLVLLALVIIVVGALSFSYMDVTGKVVSKGLTTMTTAPKLIKAGETLYVTVSPGKQGVYPEMEIYKAKNDLRLSGQSPNVCRTSRCYEKTTIPFKILDSWDNNENWDSEEQTREYYIRAYDVYSGRFVSSYFSVERAYQTKGPDAHR